MSKFAPSPCKLKLKLCSFRKLGVRTALVQTRPLMKCSNYFPELKLLVLRTIYNLFIFSILSSSSLGKVGAATFDFKGQHPPECKSNLNTVGSFITRKQYGIKGQLP